MGRGEESRSGCAGNDLRDGKRAERRFPLPPPSAPSYPVPGIPGLRSNFTKPGYLEAVGRVICRAFQETPSRPQRWRPRDPSTPAASAQDDLLCLSKYLRDTTLAKGNSNSMTK